MRSLGTEELLSHAGWIRALARRLLGDPGAADDAVQETWLAALRHPPPDGRPLRPWLARVLRNFALQRRRGEASRTRRERTAARSEALPPAADLVSRAELHRRLVEDVIALAEPYRSALLLHYFEDLPAAEIARRQGVPAATVRSHLRRGIEQLRKQQDVRHGGDGRAWCLALAPLAFPEGLSVGGPTLAGAIWKGWLTMKTLKLALAAAAVLLLALVSVRILRETGAREADSAVAAASPADGTPAPGPSSAREEAASVPLARPERTPRRVAVPLEGHLAPEPELVVEPAPTATLGGVVLDMETDAPVPHFGLKLLGPDGLEELLESDRDGRFVTATELPAGELALEPVDHAEITGLFNPHTEVRHHPELPRAEREPVTVRVQTGPTYRLEIVSAVELEAGELQAFLTSDAPHYGVEESARPFNRAPVREDQGETWVRFGRMISLSLDAVGGPWRLEVRSRDGYHAGSAMVSSVYGVHEQTVRIELMPHGRIVGTVLDRDRQPIPGAKLRLVADAEDAIPGGRRKLVADDEGRFRIDGVAPGSYLLRASSPRHHAAESPVTVQRRLELERDFRLDPLTIAGDVRGEIRSVSGEFRGLVFAWIEDPGQEGLREADVRWSRRGEEWVGSFAFVDLPPGEHTVYFQTSGNNRLEPSELQVSPPATGLSVLCIDAREPEPVAFHVYDAATGEEFPLFQVSFWSPGSFVTHPAATQRTPMRHIGGSAEFEWLVFVGGYVPCHGDETAFQPGEAGDGKPARSVEVPLVRGWGSRFHVVGPDGEALAGARILLDGAEAGTTDSEGWVLASAPSEPDAIEVLYRDWTMSGGDVDPLSGKVASRVLGVRVELAPPE